MPAVVSVSDCVPLALTVPVQPSATEPPVAVQEAPGDDIQLSITATPTVVVAALAEILSSMGAMPASGTVIGTPAEMTLRAPVGFPAVVGVYVTMTVQLPLTARDAPQVLV